MYYDYKTKNKSFLEVHEQLKLLGIKNNAFFLLLLNPALQGIDPHDPNLSDDIKMAILEECRSNIFYFLREVVRIPEQGGGTVPFKLDKGSLAALYCTGIWKNFYLMKSRQLFTTGVIIAILTWIFNFGDSNDIIQLHCTRSDVSRLNLIKINNISCTLPEYLARIVRPKLGNGGEPLISVSNGLYGGKLSTSEDMKISSDITFKFHFYDNAEPRYISEAMNQNMDKEAIYMFASVPMNKNTHASEINVEKELCIWKDSFYDLTVEEFSNKIKEQSPVYNLVYIEYDYKQLGLDRDYFINTCISLGVDEKSADLICREILLQ